MLELVQEIFAYQFLSRAAITGSILSVCAALLGVNLVLKRYSMIGDGLSHLSFGALAVAMSLGLAPYWVAVPLVILSSFLLLRISARASIRGDAALAMLSAAALSIGIIAVSLGQGLSADVYNYMFGSILTTSPAEVKGIVVFGLVVLVVYVFSYHAFFALSFDETFAAASGLNVGLYNALLAILSSCTVVLGMRLMGALLISALLIFPPLSAMRLAKSYRKVTILAIIFALIAFWLGFLASYHFSTPSGASVVVANLILYCLAWAFSKIRKSASYRQVRNA